MTLSKLDYAMSSHPGLVRKGNEDFCSASKEQGVFVVCDGMGGAAAGEVASRLAVETFTRALDHGNRAVDTVERIQRAARAANDAVYRKAKQNRELSGMGTTLVAAILDAPPLLENAESESERPEARFWIGHVGDSRCYLYRKGLLRLVTCDHSVVQEQMQAGLMTRAQAAHSPMRHIITRAIGAHAQVEAAVQPLDVGTGDIVLLASDGLNRDLSDEAIADVLSGIRTGAESLEAGCVALVDAANAVGGHDNVTVLLLRVG
ncbi:protein phosphatase 2C domain-containing protein [Granulicella sibirica]|uniref:Protein serine/threonine phosphatase PrpC, regulation of stationary phase n=1 Tax=Granulicella sibirica TaxID=2479048 RepID=A0A4Q0T6C8_9BACT|nr:PP2C family serine/threonine-protein phosphatase [Granulicella sibirica]RXH57559.1 Protein serine/threonine phosphatase PrpC, regulation of stationary phase [Granulicella sibirica]